MPRVVVHPLMFHWACERAGYGVEALVARFPKLEAWLGGEAQPTLKQLESFANATHAPVGYFFLSQPPVERVPIPDCRTIGNALVGKPTPDLLDTLYICQQRQEWYRDYARATGEKPLAFVGSAKLNDDITTAAGEIRDALGFSVDDRKVMSTWTEALRRFIEQADALGVLIMVNGVVGSNNRRRLDPAEFRGFALADTLAPLVFINGADTKAAQIFTLAHELAHLWLGESALSDVGPVSSPANKIEVWCNKVAAELLVPMAELRREYDRAAHLHEEIPRLAKYFKVSSLVILRRIFDAGGLSREELWAEYEAELARLRAITSSGGGDFYRTTAARAGKRFARAVVNATWEGRSSFTEACHLLGFKKMSTFRELGVSLGVLA